MKPVAWAFVVAGVVFPWILHVIAPDKMPWWPDTISLGLAFGFTAAVVAWKTPKDREINRRIWNTAKEFMRDRRSS